MAVSLFLVSQATTTALNTLSVSSISGGKGILSSFGQSCCSLWLVCLSSSRVPISGSTIVGYDVVIGNTVGRLSTAVVDVAVMWEAAHFSQACTFFTAFFKIVSMGIKKGKCQPQCLKTETVCRW
jgi:hypothetical protein